MGQVTVHAGEDLNRACRVRSWGGETNLARLNPLKYIPERMRCRWQGSRATAGMHVELAARNWGPRNDAEECCRLLRWYRQ
jgi:hypothetical protein